MLNSINNEKGHAILEFSLSLFFLFALTAGIVDFGNILNQYTVVTEAAHQGARFASGNSFLSNNAQVVNVGGAQSCTSAVPSAVQGKELEAHTKIQERVDQILGLSDRNLLQDSLCIATTLEDSTSGGTDKNVVVNIDVAYQSILYGRFPIKATAKAPFLQN